MLTKEGKLYPSNKQESILNNLLNDCRLMYNNVLGIKINTYQETGQTLHRFELDKIFKTYDDNIPASVKQTINNRVNIAYDRFFRKLGKFPRFKSKNRYRSIDLRQYGQDYKIEGKYLNTWKKYGLQGIKIRGLQELENPKQARLVKRASGWYLQICDEVQNKQIEKTNKETGIDMGLKYFVADSDGNTIKSPQYFRKMQRKLRIQQRKLKNKIKFSMKWKKQVKQVAKTHEYIVNQRKDFLHKVSRQYADNNDVIYAENLNIKGIVQNHHLAKSISDASWNIFLNMLGYKLKMLNRSLVLVPAHYTSQKCSSCGEIVPKTLSIRTHICPECGFIADRDINAALNILRLGQSRQATTYGNSQSVA